MLPEFFFCAEFVIIDISSDKEKCKARFACFYLSPNAFAKVENFKHACTMLTFCISFNFPPFILSDFNLPHTDWCIPVSHGGPNHKAFVKFCINNSLTQVIGDPTHRNGNIWIFYSAITSVSTVFYLIMLALPCDHSSVHFHVKWTVKMSSTKPK